MTEREEAAYTEGRKTLARELFNKMGLELGLGKNDAFRLQAERNEAIAVLRRITAEHGENEWPDDLHLADVISKYIEPLID